jgi:hypothetical protein
VKKSLILATAIEAMTTVAYAQDGSPQNCPTGYQCIPPPKCPPGYRCILTDPNAAAHAAPDATANDQEHEKAEQAWEPKTTPDPDDSPGAGPNDVSVALRPSPVTTGGSASAGASLGRTSRPSFLF